MLKKVKSLKLSVILLILAALLTAGFSYADIGNREFENLEESLEYLELMINHIQTKYKGEVTEEELMEGAYNGLFEVLDNHSNYFSPEEYQSFNVESSGSFGGIGISIGMRNGNITIIAPIEDTPGDRVGLKSGDIIKYVDSTDISEYNLTKAVKLMRGEAGTKVRLGIIRGNSSDILYFDIVREIIEINPIKHEVIEDNIGYIKILQFNDNTYVNMKAALKELLAENVEGIVVDVRNNPGGSLSEALKITDYFVPKGSPIVHIDYKGDRKETYRSQLKKIDLPLVVLVNGGSASASEIFAGAIKDTESGVIVGTKTYGKGTVQTVTPTPNGGGIKLTIAEYLTPNERKIDDVGLTPDIIVENVTDENRDDIKAFVPMIEEVKPNKGDKGLNVYGAQQRLVYLGYEVDITGILDEKTYDAIKKFQDTEGLFPYGVLDFTTKERLNQKAIDVYYGGSSDLQLEKAIEEVESFKQ